jgi:hypothetical protein
MTPDDGMIDIGGSHGFIMDVTGLAVPGRHITVGNYIQSEGIWQPPGTPSVRLHRSIGNVSPYVQPGQPRYPLVESGPGGSFYYDRSGNTYNFIPPSFSTQWNVATPLVGKRPKSPPSPIQRVEPFVGYKTLNIKVKKGQLVLKGGAYGTYGVDATAFCGSPMACDPADVPNWSHACGFYAVKDPPNKREYGGFQAQVELFGRVIKATQGFRASRQRVMSLRAFRTCLRCDDGGSSAIGFAMSKGGALFPVCKKHAFGTPPTPAELTAELGTEVSWL